MAVVAVAALALVPSASGAAAAVRGAVPEAPEPGGLLWYYYDTGIVDLVGDGFDGEGVTIAVLDGWIDTSLPIFADADIEVRSFCDFPDDVPGLGGKSNPGGTLTPGEIPAEGGAGVTHALSHGTSVTARLVGNGAEVGGVPGPVGVAPKAKILHYVVAGASRPTGDREAGGAAVCHTVGQGDAHNDGSMDALRAAVGAGADIITSSSAASWGHIREDIASREVVAVYALANDEAGYFGHTGYQGAVNVRGTRPDGELMDTLTFADEYTTVVAPGAQGGAALAATAGGGWSVVPGAGNSHAAPVMAGLLADLKTKYPQAGNGQILQSLVRNTWGAAHEPQAGDMWGWGPVEAPFLFSVDPSQYPDVNPLTGELGTLVTEPPEPSPSPSAAGPTAAPSAGPSSAPPVARDADGGVPAGLVAVLAGVVVLAGGGGAAALAVYSRTRHSETD